MPHKRPRRTQDTTAPHLRPRLSSRYGNGGPVVLRRSLGTVTAQDHVRGGRISLPIRSSSASVPTVGGSPLGEDVVAAYAAQGTPYIGVNSLSCFRKEGTLEGPVADLVAVLRYYPKSWNRHDIHVADSSFGADMAPVFELVLPDHLKRRVTKLVPLNPAKTTDLQVHYAGRLGYGYRYGHLRQRRLHGCRQNPPPSTSSTEGARISFCRKAPHGRTCTSTA